MDVASVVSHLFKFLKEDFFPAMCLMSVVIQAVTRAIKSKSGQRQGRVWQSDIHTYFSLWSVNCAKDKKYEGVWSSLSNALFSFLTQLYVLLFTYRLQPCATLWMSSRRNCLKMGAITSIFRQYNVSSLPRFSFLYPVVAFQFQLACLPL